MPEKLRDPWLPPDPETTASGALSSNELPEPGSVVEIDNVWSVSPEAGKITEATRTQFRALVASLLKRQSQGEQLRPFDHYILQRYGEATESSEETAA